MPAARWRAWRIRSRPISWPRTASLLKRSRTMRTAAARRPVGDHPTIPDSGHLRHRTMRLDETATSPSADSGRLSVSGLDVRTEHRSDGSGQPEHDYRATRAACSLPGRPCPVRDPRPGSVHGGASALASLGGFGCFRWPGRLELGRGQLAEAPPCGRRCAYLSRQQDVDGRDFGVGLWWRAGGLLGQPSGCLVGQAGQAGVVGLPVVGLVPGHVQPPEVGVGEGGALGRRPLRPPLRHASPNQRPARAFRGHGPLAGTNGAYLVEEIGYLGRQDESFAGNQPGELPAELFEVPDPALERLVDLGDGAGELGGVEIEELTDPVEGHAGVGEGLDPDQVDHGLGVVAAVARAVTDWLSEQAPLVVVADGPDRDTDVSGELTDGQHRALGSGPRRWPGHCAGAAAGPRLYRATAQR